MPALHRFAAPFIHIAYITTCDSGKLNEISGGGHFCGLKQHTSVDPTAASRCRLAACKAISIHKLDTKLMYWSGIWCRIALLQCGWRICAYNILRQSLSHKLRLVLSLAFGFYARGLRPILFIRCVYSRTGHCQ